MDQQFDVILSQEWSYTPYVMHIKAAEVHDVLDLLFEGKGVLYFMLRDFVRCLLYPRYFVSYVTAGTQSWLH